MTTRDRPGRPARGRAVVERLADGIRITLPPRGLGVSKVLCLLAGLGGLVPVLYFSLVLGLITGTWTGVATLVAVYLLVVLYELIRLTAVAQRRAALTAAGGRLHVRTAGLVRTRQWDWPREVVQSIHVHLGLVVRAAGKDHRFAPERPEDELRWLARTLREALFGTDECAAEAGELPVRFTDPDHPEPSEQR